MTIFPAASPVAVVASPPRQAAADAIVDALRAAYTPRGIHRWILPDGAPRRAAALGIIDRGCHHLVTLTDVQSAIETVEQILAAAHHTGRFTGWVHADPMSPEDVDQCRRVSDREGLRFHNQPVPAEPDRLGLAKIVVWLSLAERRPTIRRPKPGDNPDTTNHPTGN